MNMSCNPDQSNHLLVRPKYFNSNHQTISKIVRRNYEACVGFNINFPTYYLHWLFYTYSHNWGWATDESKSGKEAVVRIIWDNFTERYRCQPNGG